MFYQPENGHGLPHNPFKAIVSPRPIAWISTRDAAGQNNLAPYSFFNAVADTPPQIMFASTGAKPDRNGTKDTMDNIRETGVFCVNILGYEDRDRMNASSAGVARGVDEFALAGVQAQECERIACARAKGVPASLECELQQIVQLAGPGSFMAIGNVVGVHLRDDCLVDGMFDVTKYQPLARLGYKDYATVRDVFSLKRPGE